jgi:glycosyltransferase involved in cell wall biosynthesis
MNTPKKIAFVSTMNGAPWGGSEALWAEAARHLVRQGHQVSANIYRWPNRAKAVTGLMESGVRITERWHALERVEPAPLRRFLQRFFSTLIHRGHRKRFLVWIENEAPDLICISNGDVGDYERLIGLCRQSGRPYTLVAHANAEHLWPSDEVSQDLIDTYTGARRAFFVSEGNRALLEVQLGVKFTNAEVVRNPFNVRRDAAPPWPTSDEPVRLACIGRLAPEAKGQDLLFQVLAQEPWKSRPLEVSIYGTGPVEAGLKRLAKMLGVEKQVRFCGHDNDIEKVWATHHAMVLPSRFEGLPIVTVEAMLCGRPVIVTDVAGNREIVKDGITGFVADAPTVRHLNEAMERAWQRRVEWQAMGQAGAKLIRQLVPVNAGVEFGDKLLAVASR